MEEAATQAKQLTADAILQARDFVEKEVDVPEWGGVVRVRSLSMGARYEINDRAVRTGGKDQKIDNLAFAACTLEFGLVEPKLTRTQAEQAVKYRASEPINRICAAVWEISGLAGGEAEAKNA